MSFVTGYHGTLFLTTGLHDGGENTERLYTLYKESEDSEITRLYTKYENARVIIL